MDEAGKTKATTPPPYRVSCAVPTFQGLRNTYGLRQEANQDTRVSLLLVGHIANMLGWARTKRISHSEGDVDIAALGGLP